MNYQKIIATRMVKGLSQADLAKLAKVDRAYISQIESGKKTPSLSVLSRIAKALDCSIKDFF